MAGPVTNYQDAVPRLFSHGLYDESATALQRIGTVRKLDDGRKFVYARAGAVALAVSKLTQIADTVATNHNEAVAAIAAIGDTRVSVTIGAAELAANYYKDGFLHVNDVDGKGHLYKVRGHKLITSEGTGWFELYDRIRVALSTSSEVTLTKHPADGVIITPGTGFPTSAIVGVPPIAVTALYYFWLQVKGICAILHDTTLGTTVVGKRVAPAYTVAGAVEDCILTEGTPNADFPQQVCGTVVQVNADAEYALINLHVPGF